MKYQDLKKLVEEVEEPLSKFQGGVKKYATVSRKKLNEISKLCNLMRKEILVTKKGEVKKE
jgi:hypothetical protein